MPKPQDVLFPALTPIITLAKNSGDQFLVAAAQNLGAIGTKFDKETQTAISNALTNPAQGVRDVVQNHVKIANDIVDGAAMPGSCRSPKG